MNLKPTFLQWLVPIGGNASAAKGAAMRSGRRRRVLLTAEAALVSALILNAAPVAALCEVTASVVAMDQVITYNRMGAFNPAGMIFALERDIQTGTNGGFCVNATDGTVVLSHLTQCSTDSECGLYGSCDLQVGNVQLRPDKRPRPLTLRVNEGCNITINLRNLLSPSAIPDAQNEAPGIQLPDLQSEQPFTRSVGIHVNGMQVKNISDDGSNAGGNNSLVAPGGSASYTLYAEKEGAYVITSGPNLGGEGGAGAIASGLFGVLNVEPTGSTWYRSQVTRAEMVMALNISVDKTSVECSTDGFEFDPEPGYTCAGQPVLKYDAVYPTGHAYADMPIFKILDGSGNIFHNELNAIITGGLAADGTFCSLPEILDPTNVYPDSCEPFREFTVAFHDEIKVVQAFPQWYDELLPFTLSSVKDGFAINYGTGGIGSEIIANRLGLGPMKDCVDCKYEEFFLTSWAVGDPAMIVDVPATISDPNAVDGSGHPAPVIATKAFYPEDPSNVWHGYLNDRTKIRNIHVGSEHHIFHLHAHQWLFAAEDLDSNYVDAQAIGPGSSFTYEITWGGGGNRNKTAGDSIFHCHFYPHFAQGMWGLWRVHDVFEIGTTLDAEGRPKVGSRALPDGEIAAGTPIPGVVPLPGKAMPPMPGAFVTTVQTDANGDGVYDSSQVFMERLPGKDQLGNPGYPFFIPGVAGHRPPTAPMDLVDNGGLPRHVITGGQAHSVQDQTNFEKEVLVATAIELPEGGTDAELAAMDFHGPADGTMRPKSSFGIPYHDSYATDLNGSVSSAGFQVNGLAPVEGAPYADPCRGDLWSGTWSDTPIGTERIYKAAVIELDVQLNKVGWHFNQSRILTLLEDVNVSLSGTRAPEPFVMRANTYDCIDFDHTNLVPSIYQLDDYQVKTPTDVIGQHIHLVKFDVMTADGSANGWNYEDGTFSPNEVQERIHAIKGTLTQNLCRDSSNELLLPLTECTLSEDCDGFLELGETPTCGLPEVPDGVSGFFELAARGTISPGYPSLTPIEARGWKFTNCPVGTASLFGERL